MPKRPYPAWQRRHEAILRWLLEHPGGKLYTCAIATDYSASQVSRIVNSPDFRRRFTRALEAGLREAYLRGMFGRKSTTRDGQ